jgi:hypothetical protein
MFAGRIPRCPTVGCSSRGTPSVVCHAESAATFRPTKRAAPQPATPAQHSPQQEVWNGAAQPGPNGGARPHPLAPGPGELHPAGGDGAAEGPWDEDEPPGAFVRDERPWRLRTDKHDNALTRSRKFNPDNILDKLSLDEWRRNLRIGPGQIKNAFVGVRTLALVDRSEVAAAVPDVLLTLARLAAVSLEGTRRGDGSTSPDKQAAMFLDMVGHVAETHPALGAALRSHAPTAAWLDAMFASAAALEYTYKDTRTTAAMASAQAALQRPCLSFWAEIERRRIVPDLGARQLAALTLNLGRLVARSGVAPPSDTLWAAIDEAIEARARLMVAENIVACLLGAAMAGRAPSAPAAEELFARLVEKMPQARLLILHPGSQCVSRVGCAMHRLCAHCFCLCLCVPICIGIALPGKVAVSLETLVSIMCCMQARATQLADAAWALAMLHMPVPDGVVSDLAFHAARKTHRASARDVARTLWAVIRLGVKPEAALVDGAPRPRSAWPLRLCALPLLLTCLLQAACDAVLVLLGAGTCEVVGGAAHTLDGAHCAMIIWALGMLKVPPPSSPLWADLTAIAARTAAQMRPEALAQTVAALTQAKVSAPPELRSALAPAIEAQCPHMGAAEVASTMWGVLKLSVDVTPGLPQALCAAIVRTGGDMHAKGRGMTSNALKKLGWPLAWVESEGFLPQ